MSHAALGTLLPTIDPEIARTQSDVARALDGAPAADGVLAVSSADLGRRPAIRFQTDAADIEIIPLLVDGAVPLLAADDGAPDAVLAVAAMAGLEPLLAAVETALGVALRPVAVLPAELPVRLRVAIGDGTGGERHVAIFATSPGFTPAAQMRAADRVDVAHLAVPASFVARGPLISAGRLAALQAGDFVLIGGRELAGSFFAGGRHWPGRLSPANAHLTISENRSTRVSDSENRTDGLDPDLRLAIEVRIDGGTVRLGDLQQLTPGSVVPLGITGASLPVTLEVSGAAVAAGDLVAVGDAYGVLIRHRIGPAS